jgi:uncharacterized protein (TIGR00159 family)
MPVVEMIKLGDLLDVAVVALLIYFLLSSLGRARARAFMLVLGGVGALHILARAFGLHLSSMLMGAGLWIISLVVVIAFQDDIKRSIHRITAWRMLGGRGSAAETSSRDDLVESLLRMAEKRVGALIVIPGHETLQPHVTGGLPLDGKWSGPLLESIFSPDSPGHDGAVILENGTVRRFGVHLPLSRRLEEVGQLGTRHTAALGLSERCDALVIVVSEERGEISIAKEGALHQNLERKQLTARLAEHGGAGKRQEERTPGGSLARGVIAILSATLLWFTLIFREGTVQQTMQIPVEYRNVPEQLALLDPRPARVKVTLAGRRAAFGELTENEVRAALDLSEMPPGFHRIAIDRSDVTLPATLEVLEIQPSMVNLRLKARVERPE